MNYQESLDFILGTPSPGNVYERNVMLPLLAKLGNPHKGLKYVHIAGTNGKGSPACCGKQDTGQGSTPPLISSVSTSVSR